MTIDVVFSLLCQINSMDSFQSTIQQMLNEDKRRDTFKLLASLTGLKLNREEVMEIFIFLCYSFSLSLSLSQYKPTKI
jgi:hypothetical protein